MKNIEKVKMKDIDLSVRATTSLVLDIDIFRFINRKDVGYVTIYMEKSGEYEFVDEVEIEKPCDDIEELKIIALDWIVIHVEIVKEVES